MPRDSSESSENSEDDDSTENYQQDETSRQNSSEKNKNNDSETKTNYAFWAKLTVLVILLAWLVSVYVKAGTKSNLEHLKQIFPNQPNETFEYFEAVLDDILFTQSIHPAVFLFLYDRNESTVNNLVHHLAIYSSEKLDTNNNYIDVHKNEFHTNDASNDYGYLLDKYKSDLLEKKVMVVKNLQNIPAQTAQVFHSFCDEITPLVEKVVYIFTLKVKSLAGKEEKVAETNLKMLWKELDNDILMPLITRVTGTVLKIIN